MLLDPETKKKYLEKLLTDFIKDEILSELKISNISSLFTKQNSMNFINHRKKYQELQMKGIRPEFVSFNNGIVLYKIKSTRWNAPKRKNVPTEYLLGIRFADWNKFYDDPQMTMGKRVEKLMKGDIGLGCGCPAFRYYYGYQTHLKGADFYDENFSNNRITEPATERNPSNVGIGCKHLDRLMNIWNYRTTVKSDILKSVQTTQDKSKKTRGNPISPSAPNSKQAQKKK